MRGAPGPFVAPAGVQTDKTVESLQEFFKELDGMRQPVPADELDAREEPRGARLPGRVRDDRRHGRQPRPSSSIYGLPESFFSEYVPKIQAVTAADVERAAKQYLQTDKFAVVVVGDLAKIEKPIRDANFGPVKVVTVDEILK